ncbi:unnamed protein product [Zymoseptoria tritici ST99CH_3D7]|uniref:RanBP2-type domain-containing protein n=1 Tax=Zymoseptoria tritici (strain ST99CH_3D7) TaxID=1276538 RepID=A0A1X7RPS6_ZYMT9|nr:unnamed protein product [Zymoseptoria tritici ST99CH_3D7]
MAFNTSASKSHAEHTHHHNDDECWTNNDNEDILDRLRNIGRSFGANMRGWWVCCNCRHTNGPYNTPTRCPICGHNKDAYCFTY